MAMGWLQVLIMSTVAAMTNVLPLSESGHGATFRKLLGLPLDGSADGLLNSLNYLVIALVILLVFRREFMQGATRRTLGQGRRVSPSQERRMTRSRLITLMIVGFFPMIPFIVFYGRLAVLGERLLPVAGIMVILGFLVFSADRTGFGKRELMEVNLTDALLIGLFLGLGLIPGLSPVTMAIVMCLWRGLSPVFSVKLSCLMAVPLLLFRCVLGIAAHVGSGFGFRYIVGMVICGVVTYLALRLARFVAQRGSFGEFATVLWGSAAFAFILSLVS